MGEVHCGRRTSDGDGDMFVGVEFDSLSVEVRSLSPLPRRRRRDRLCPFFPTLLEAAQKLRFVAWVSADPPCKTAGFGRVPGRRCRPLARHSILQAIEFCSAPAADGHPRSPTSRLISLSDVASE
jgi:hypothetical protein